MICFNKPIRDNQTCKLIKFHIFRFYPTFDMLYLNVYRVQKCKKHLCYNLFWVPTSLTGLFDAGVPVYLAPWTACPPGGKPTAVSLPPGGKLSRDILPPTLVIFTPGGQAVQASLSCPPPIQRIFFCVMFTIICNISIITCNS